MTSGPSTPEPVSGPALSPGPALLPYAPLPRERTARRIRWIILLAALLLGFIALLANPLVWQAEQLGWGIMGTPVGPLLEGGLDDRIAYLLHAGGFLGLFLLTEWLFLFPRGRLSFQTSERRRSRRSAAVAGGFMGMLLTAGVAATVMEWGGVWRDSLAAELRFGGMLLYGLHAFWAAMAAAWVLWAVIFYAYYRDADHHTAIARITRALLAGTILELLVAVPTYVKALGEPDNCRCEKGSYTGLVFGCTAVFWLFGPGVYLLLLRERRRYTPRV